MATEQQVKLYLAYWFQLGKRVLLRNGEEALEPKPVFSNSHYSAIFESCWQRLIDPKSGDCYLEGTDQTIQQLLSSSWEIVECAKCKMPVPISNFGYLSQGCPCFDLPGWPNLEIPFPRNPVNSRQSLQDICQRLQDSNRWLVAKKVRPKSLDDDEESHK